MAVTERDRLPESELARRFRQHVLADVDYLKSRGYNPTRFLGMIAQNKSVVTVAKMLFAKPRLTSSADPGPGVLRPAHRPVPDAVDLALDKVPGWQWLLVAVAAPVVTWAAWLIQELSKRDGCGSSGVMHCEEL